MTHLIEQYGLIQQRSDLPGVECYHGQTPGQARPVMVRLTTTEWALADPLRERLTREATAYRTLEHPQIVPLLDFGQTPEGGLFFMTARPAGPPLSNQLERAWSVKDVARLIKELVLPLDFAHARRIIHAALSPTVIMLPKRQPALIADFAIRRTLLDGREPHTSVPPADWCYLAPEIVEGRAFDHRVDVYALGALAYRLLAGAAWAALEQRAITPGKYQALPLASILIPNLPPGLSDVLTRAVEFQPAARWPTTSALAEAFEKHSATGGRHSNPMAHSLGRRSTRDFGRAQPAADTTDSQASEPLLAESSDVGRLDQPSTAPTAENSPLSGPPTLPPAQPGYEWRQVRHHSPAWRVLAFISKMLIWLVTTMAVSVVLLILAVSLLVATVTERVLSVQTWNLAAYDPAGPATISTAEFQIRTAALMSTTLGGVLSNVQFDFTPPNAVTVTGRWDTTPLTLKMQVFPIEGVLQLRLLTLNGSPLPVVGDILSDGINRGLRASWSRTATRIDRLDFTGQQIVAYLQRPIDYHDPTPAPIIQPAAIPLSTAAPTAAATVTQRAVSTAAVQPSVTPGPTKKATVTPSPLSSATSSVSAGITPSPIRPTAPALPDGLGRILFTTDLGGLYLYSIDPSDGRPKQIGQTDAAHSTCGRQVSTAEGVGFTTYFSPYCSLARLAICTSPDGQWEAVYSAKGRSDGSGTLRVQPAGNEAQSRFIIDGVINAGQGIRWAPNSSGFIFYVGGNYFLARPDADGYQPVGSGDILSWSPDSTMLLIKAINEVGLQRLDGTPLQYLIQGQLVSIIQCPVWRGY